MQIEKSLTRPAVHVSPQLSLWIIIFLLLFLRIPLDGWLVALFSDTQVWVNPIYQIASYSLIAFFIWLQRDHLADYHFDRLALAFFLLFKPLYTLLYIPFSSNPIISPLVFPHLPALSFWLVAILLWLALCRPRSRWLELRPLNWRWIIFAILLGLAEAVFAVFVMPTWMTADDAYVMTPLFLLLKFPITLGSAAALEDPLFFALLWGQLCKAGWKEIWIWLSVALVFTFAHGAKFFGPDAILWVMFTFAGLLVYGWIVWRSRSIANSMIAHTMLNSASLLINVVALGAFH